MSKWDDFKKNREGFANAQSAREGQHELHKRQRTNYAFRKDLDDFRPAGSESFKSLTRLRFYVSLGDPALGPFIQDAKSKAITAYLSGQRDWHHHYHIDIADVAIRLKGRKCEIRIIAVDEFYVEFATSAHPIVTDTVVVDGTSYPSYSGCVVGCTFRAKDGNVTLTSTINEQRRSVNGDQLSRVHRPFQVQITDEPVHYPKGESRFNRWRYQHTLFSTYAPGHSMTGIMKRTTLGPSSTFVGTKSPGPLGSYTFRDIDLDVPFQHGRRADPIQSAYIRGAADWPRKSGLQVVQTQWGDREFAIYLDAYNQFAVFPVSRIDPLNNINPMLQNVSEMYVRRVSPSMPAWAYVPTDKAKDYWALNPNLDEWTIDQPELDWRFNHLGTKCCAVVYQREPYDNDTAYWTTDQNPDCPWTDAKFDNWASNLGVEFAAQEIDATAYQPQRYFVAPGVVEVSINISVTGPNDEDFDVSLTVSEVVNPSTAYAMPVLAGYTWHDIPSGGQSNKPLSNSTPLARCGDLIIAYIEYWVRPRGDDGTSSQRDVIWSIRKASSNTELLSYPRFPVMAFDFQTLSFVFMVENYRRERRAVSLRTGAPGAPSTDEKLFSVREFGAWIITLGQSREFLFPNRLTADARERLQALAAETGRARIERLIADQGADPWGLIPLTSSKDDWGDTQYNEYRDWFGYQNHFYYEHYWALIDSDLSFYGDRVKYKLSGSPPSLTAGAQAARKELNALDGSHPALLFCDAPKWHWHAYAGLLPTVMYKHPHNTFFAHPNGSYAFWDAGWIFDDNGVIGNAGTGYGDDLPTTGTEFHYDTLTPYDASLIEHVIFDAVRFQLRTTKGVIAKRDTSFLELYNRAVVAGKEAETLEAGIDEVSYADMKATFTKEIANNGTYDFLDLKATWLGTDWWFGDQIVLGEPYDSFPYIAGTAGNLYGVNFWQFWRTTNFAGAGVSRVPGFPDPDHLDVWNYRFANMLIVDART